MYKGWDTPEMSFLIYLLIADKKKLTRRTIRKLPNPFSHNFKIV